MTPTARAMVRGGWLRLAVAGVVMVSVTMTTATAAVVAPASAVTPTAGRPGPGGTSPRSPFPGFVLSGAAIPPSRRQTPTSGCSPST